MQICIIATEYVSVYRSNRHWYVPQVGPTTSRTNRIFYIYIMIYYA